ncbi:carbohydrate ABC transporter substrate-binding protein (CUT1 family) [Kribbella amoyensis]|uniref:Carbohydrate ABC transporter substrate-binding protein (CUT1 family) n=1 Tax=Kribbella amoyensis TaxID=996641 RepID=A0A561BQT3_9ACTN|nr:extracellular solute-binding protein [Kribbella amoyensis]TWD81240.1 carbohydrate ABC transporter substrate-binding protein (CUT1 family) [Kribbella amoyensis]
MKHLRLPAVLAAGTLVLTSCAGVGTKDDVGGGSGDSSAESTPSGALNIMGFSGEDEVAQSRIAAFKTAYPGVTVKNNKGDFDAQQFLTAVSSGNAPDVAYMARNLIGTYAAKGAIQPLDDCIKNNGIDTTQYREAALNEVKLSDKTYGIPEFYTVTTNLISGKALKSAGVPVTDIQTADWDKLEQTAKKLYKAKGGRPARLGFDPKMPDFFPLWAMANGAELVKQGGEPNLNDPKAVEALTYTLTLIQAQGGWSNFKTFRDTFDLFGEKNQFTADQLAAFPIENWYVNVLLDSRKNGLELQSTMFTDRQGQPISTIGGSAWVVPKGAKNFDAACKFAKTMTSVETWNKAAEARMQTVAKDKSFFTGLFTGNKTADDEIKAKYLKPTGDAGFDQAINNYYDVLDKSKSLNPSPAGAEIDAAWKNAVGKALAGTATPQAALDQAQTEAKAAFDKAPQG